mmetsp:Transcript_11642/g.33525  ORF Transcript_11642/g.33525 Transcript_11642/m.33525 type:complete len:248 (+) Transcript_11642:877-1620(+)
MILSWRSGCKEGVTYNVAGRRAEAEILQHVDHPPTDAGVAQLLVDIEAMDLLLLHIMREQRCSRLCPPITLRDDFIQDAHAGEKHGISGVVQLLCDLEFVVDSKFSTRLARGFDRQEIGLAQCNRSSDVLVIFVHVFTVALAFWHQHVEGIHAASEHEIDHRLVRIGLWGSGRFLQAGLPTGSHDVVGVEFGSADDQLLGNTNCLGLVSIHQWSDLVDDELLVGRSQSRCCEEQRQLINNLFCRSRA